MSIRCAIVDDEKLAREGLRILLSKCGEFPLEIVGEGTSAKEAVALVKAHKPDLLFLDINMPEKSGFEIFRLVDQADMPFVVFVTAHARFAVKGFEADAVDYLLKPVSEIRLAESLRRVQARIAAKDVAERSRAMHRLLKNKQNISAEAVERILKTPGGPGVNRLQVSDGGRRVHVDVNDIVYIRAAGDYMCITTPDNAYVNRSTMKQLISALNPRQFFRVHRSTVVNIDYIQEVVSLGHCRYNLLMANGEVLQSSKNYRQSIRGITAQLENQQRHA